MWFCGTGLSVLKLRKIDQVYETRPYFEVNIDKQFPSAILTTRGRVNTLDSKVKIQNSFPINFTRHIHIFNIHHVFNTLIISVKCPSFYTHLADYQLEPLDTEANLLNTSSKILGNFIYKCGVCAEKYYTVSANENTLSYNNEISDVRETFEAKKGCIPCPYGAVCSGNNVVPKPNYWGYWHKEELVFQQCPAGYCCSGSTSEQCIEYNWCAGNRTGVLCGVCKQNFAVSILSGKCILESQCKDTQWFWLLMFMATVGYALWYTCKDLAFKFIFCFLKRLKTSCHCRKYSKDFNGKQLSLHGSKIIFNLSKLNKTQPLPPKNSHEDNKSTTEVDKGYFGIIAYFIQIAEVIRIKTEFGHSDDGESFLNVMLTNIKTFLNVEYISFDACPIPGLTMLGRQAYRFGFLVGIYIGWLIIFAFTYVILYVVQRKETNALNRHMGKMVSFQLHLIRGLIEIIKYTYSGFCGIVFMLLTCVKVGNEYVWWYDASNTCLETWQILTVIFGLCYAVPLPFALIVGMQLLHGKQISATVFIFCMLCPIATLYFYIKHKNSETESGSSQKHLSKASRAIISVLQGPYRKDDRQMTLYWEAMVSIRRLLISALTLIGFPTVRLILITVLCIAFLSQHMKYAPFQVQKSNKVEWLSLFLLSVTSIINLLKASMIGSGSIPSGPYIPLFEWLEIFEKAFVFIIALYILEIEVMLKLHTGKKL